METVSVLDLNYSLIELTWGFALCGKHVLSLLLGPYVAPLDLCMWYIRYLVYHRIFTAWEGAGKKIILKLKWATEAWRLVLSVLLESNVLINVNADFSVNLTRNRLRQMLRAFEIPFCVFNILLRKILVSPETFFLLLGFWIYYKNCH